MTEKIKTLVFDQLGIVKDEIEILFDIYKENNIYFDKAIELLKFSYNLLIDAWNSLEKNHKDVEELNSKINILALFLQSIRLFRSIVILFKSGLDNESIILIRPLTESISYLVYLTENNQKERYDRYMHSRWLSDYTKVNEFFREEKKSSWSEVFQHHKKQFEKALEYFKSKYGNSITLDDIKKKYALKPLIAAQEIKNKSFRIHYMRLCGIISPIIHAEKPSAYIQLGRSAEEARLKIDPTYNEKLPFYLTEAMMFVLDGDRTINEFLKTGKDDLINEWVITIDKLGHI